MMDEDKGKEEEVRFLTASGRPMKIDPEALKKARSLFAAEDLNQTDPMRILGATLLEDEDGKEEEVEEKETRIRSVENFPTPRVLAPVATPRRGSAFKPPTMLRQSPSCSGVGAAGSSSPLANTGLRNFRGGRGGFQSPVMRSGGFQSPMLGNKGSASNPSYKAPRRSMGAVSGMQEPPSKKYAPSPIMNPGPGGDAPVLFPISNRSPSHSTVPKEDKKTETMDKRSDDEEDLELDDLDLLNRSSSPIL